MDNLNTIYALVRNFLGQWWNSYGAAQFPFKHSLPLLNVLLINYFRFLQDTRKTCANFHRTIQDSLVVSPDKQADPWRVARVPEKWALFKQPSRRFSRAEYWIRSSSREREFRQRRRWGNWTETNARYSGGKWERSINESPPGRSRRGRKRPVLRIPRVLPTYVTSFRSRFRKSLILEQTSVPSNSPFA